MRDAYVRRLYAMRVWDMCAYGLRLCLLRGCVKDVRSRALLSRNAPSVSRYPCSCGDSRFRSQR